jgi:hypothetical protein
MPTTPRAELVEVKQRESVAGFETVTLAAREPHALALWLSGHGYAAPDGLERVAADYVRDGWVFNAIRLRRDADTQAVNRIQPIAFTFATPSPVYPMRLTGLTTHPVNVRLFVAGPSRAAADGFAATRCAELTTESSRNSGPGIVAIERYHADNLLDGTQYVTRLDRTFEPDEMGTDVAVTWQPYARMQTTVFSEDAAGAIAWTLGGFVAIGAFIALASAAGSRMTRTRGRPRDPWIATVAVLALSVAVAGGVELLLPQAETRSVETASR